MDWHYEKLDVDYKLQQVSNFTNDTDRSITGKIVINVKAYFDENPGEARRLGWTKHITHTQEEIKELCPYNQQTQYLVVAQRQVDEFTVEDTYHAIDKSAEMLRLEELMEAMGYGSGIVSFMP